MANSKTKEYTLENRVRELLVYTVHATRVTRGEADRRDVRRLFERLAAMEDLRDVKTVCDACIRALATDAEKPGFTKSTYRLYGEDMRQTAKRILLDFHAANNKLFATEYAERMQCINALMDDCSLLLDYVQVCLDEHIISTGRAAEWTKKITDVKYMAGAWKRTDTARAQKLEADKQAREDDRLRRITAEAVRGVIEERTKRNR